MPDLVRHPCLRKSDEFRLAAPWAPDQVRGDDRVGSSTQPNTTTPAKARPRLRDIRGEGMPFVTPTIPTGFRPSPGVIGWRHARPARRRAYRCPTRRFHDRMPHGLAHHRIIPPVFRGQLRRGSPAPHPSSQRRLGSPAARAARSRRKTPAFAGVTARGGTRSIPMCRIRPRHAPAQNIVIVSTFSTFAPAGPQRRLALPPPRTSATNRSSGEPCSWRKARRLVLTRPFRIHRDLPPHHVPADAATAFGRCGSEGQDHRRQPVGPKQTRNTELYGNPGNADPRRFRGDAERDARRCR